MRETQMSKKPHHGNPNQDTIESKRDVFDYPPPDHLPLDVQEIMRAHRFLFSRLLSELRRMYGSNRYVSLTAQDLEAAESRISKAAEFYGKNKIG